MTTAHDPAPETTDTGDLTHVVCECTPEIALCGADVSGQPWVDEGEETTCVVCRDLEDLSCTRSGQ